MPTVPDFIVRGLNAPPLGDPPVPVPPGTRDVVTGEEIFFGYPAAMCQTDTQSEFLDTFRGWAGQWVSETTARAFRSDRNMGARLFFEDAAYYPMISREQAEKQNRTCWSDLVREVWPVRAGQNLVCLLTTDSKKRIWTRARVGALGPHTLIYVHDGDLNISVSAAVNWPRLIAVLGLIERAYGAGFAKDAIRTGLAAHWKTASRIGIPETVRMERELTPLRSQPEFIPALLVAQKENAPCHSNCSRRRRSRR